MKKNTLKWAMLILISLTSLTFSQGTYVFPGNSLSGSYGGWGGSGHFYTPTFNVNATGGIDITYYDIDLSQLRFGNTWELKGYAEPGVSRLNSMTGLDPKSNSVWGVFHNQEIALGTDWNGNSISTLGSDGLTNTSDDTRHGSVQDWYRGTTGGKTNGPGADIAHNNESYVTPNPRYSGATPKTASEFNTYDFRLRVLPTGSGTYTYEMWTRMHNAASNFEGCGYCGCGTWNHAINNCGSSAAWRVFSNGGNTVFPISGFDLSSVYVFMGLGNGNNASNQSLTWGRIEVTGTPTSTPSVVWVDPTYTAGGINGGHVWGYDAFTTIQGGIDGVAATGTVNVMPGTYNQDEANGYDPVTGGSGSSNFNIFVNKSVTIQGVTTLGAPITNYSGVLAYVIPKRNTPLGNLSTFFIQANNVTISGLDVTAFSDPAYNFKTISVIGENATIKYCKLHNLDQVSCIYMYDPRYNSGTDISYITTYRFEGNLLDAGGIYASGIRISSGPGWTGSEVNRIITGNAITGGSYGIEFVGPGGDPWDVYPVGAATITSNSFSGADKGSVVAWGKYLGVEGYGNIDWDGIFSTNLNTFDKAVLVKKPDNTVRYFDITSGPPNFYFIRGIYSAIQRYPINRVSQAGDIVYVAAGTYNENVIVNKQLTLDGAGSTIGGTIITPPSGSGIVLSASGSSSSSRLILKDLLITGAAANGIDIQAANTSYLTFNNVACVSNTGYGINTNPPVGSGNFVDFQVTNCNLSSNNVGFRFATYVGINGLTITGGNIDGNQYGIQTNTGFGNPIVTNVFISGTTFNNNVQKGLYFEDLDNATLTGINVINSGTATTSHSAGIDINLKYNNFQNISILNSTISGCGINDPNGGGILIKARSTGGYAGNPATLNNVTLTNVTVTSNGGGTWAAGIRIGESNNSFTGIDAGPTNVVISSSKIYGNSVHGVRNATLASMVVAKNNWWGHPSGPKDTKTLPNSPSYNNPSGLGDAVTPYVDYNPWIVNTPTTPFALYLSNSSTVLDSLIYPNDLWPLPAGVPFTNYVGEPNDWGFLAGTDYYVVPEVGSFFGASTIVVEWDNTQYGYVGVTPGNIYGSGYFNTLLTTTGNITRLTIDGGLYNVNQTTPAGGYIAKVSLTLLKTGYAPVNFYSYNFRYYDGLGGQGGVYFTDKNAKVKNYLGDVVKSPIVSPPTPLDQSTGDGKVNVDDLTFWSASYWSGVTGFTPLWTNYKAKYDIGPTSTNTVYGMPTTDLKIQFEDLVIFAMSYGLSGNGIYPKAAPVPTEPVEISVGKPIASGNETLVPIFISGAVQDLRAASFTISGSFGKLISADKGDLLNSYSTPVMVMSRADGNNVFVDLSIVGADVQGLSQEGQLVVLRFEGKANVNLTSADLRNVANSAMLVKFNGNSRGVPTEFGLSQNYPNPFNPSTVISYQVPIQSAVEISVFNSIGEKLATLINEVKEPGYYEVTWNAQSMTSGVYFFRVNAGEFMAVKKMLLMK